MINHEGGEWGKRWRCLNGSDFGSGNRELMRIFWSFFLEVHMY